MRLHQPYFFRFCTIFFLIVIINSKDKKMPLLFLNNKKKILTPCFFHPIIWPYFFQGHKPTHVFTYRLVGADWLGDCLVWITLGFRMMTQLNNRKLLKFKFQKGSKHTSQTLPLRLLFHLPSKVTLVKQAIFWWKWIPTLLQKVLSQCKYYPIIETFELGLEVKKWKFHNCPK